MAPSICWRTRRESSACLVSGSSPYCSHCTNCRTSAKSCCSCRAPCRLRAAPQHRPNARPGPPPPPPAPRGPELDLLGQDVVHPRLHEGRHHPRQRGHLGVAGQQLRALQHLAQHRLRRRRRVFAGGVGQLCGGDGVSAAAPAGRERGGWGGRGAATHRLGGRASSACPAAWSGRRSPPTSACSPWRRASAHPPRTAGSGEGRWGSASAGPKRRPPLPVRCGAVSAGCGPPELRQRPYLNAGGRGADLQAQPPLVVGAQPSVGREVLRAALGLREGCAHQQLQRVRLGLQQLRGGQR